MKDIKVKYSLIALSYLFLIFLIIISYVSITPTDDVPILENTKSLIKEPKFKKILQKPLKHDNLNNQLYKLAIEISSQQPDVVKRAEDLLKRYPPEN